MNLELIQRAAEIAKTRTNDKRWLTAIDRAVAGFESWIVTELADHILVTTDSGETYHANGACQCKAYTDGGKSACKHRALYRLIQIANETEAAEEAARRCDLIIADIKEIAADVAASPRKQLIIEIENVWPKTWPPLYTELLARFGKSDLSALDDDQLRRVRLAIAL
jgi:hypothetical protein